MFNTDRAGQKRPALTADESLPTCPRCDEPVTGIATRGPTDHRATPCGCRLGSARLQDVDQERRVATDGGQREVYYAAGYSNGTLVWHDDEDCRALAQATNVHSAPLSHIEDRRDRCEYCAGYVPEPDDQDHSYQDSLKDADPEAITDGGAPDPDAFRIPTVDEIDAMRTHLGLTQKGLSRRAGHNEGLFNTILRRDMDPQTETLRSFLEVLREAEEQSDEEIDRTGPKPERSSLSRRTGTCDDQERDWTDYEQTAARLEQAPPDVVGDDGGGESA